MYKSNCTQRYLTTWEYLLCQQRAEREMKQVPGQHTCTHQVRDDLLARYTCPKIRTCVGSPVAVDYDVIFYVVPHIARAACIWRRWHRIRSVSFLVHIAHHSLYVLRACVVAGWNRRSHCGHCNTREMYVHVHGLSPARMTAVFVCGFCFAALRRLFLHVRAALSWLMLPMCKVSPLLITKMYHQC